MHAIATDIFFGAEMKQKKSCQPFSRIGVKSYTAN